MAPVALEAIRVLVRRAGSGRLEPEHGVALGLVERVDAADAGPEDVAGPERVALPVRDDLDLAVEHEIRLLERMVVRVRHGAGLVEDHEHRLELRIEALVDEHLDRDAAVGEGRRRHAGRHRRRVDGGALLEPVDVHVVRPEQEEMAIPRIADVERRRLGVGRRAHEERVRRLIRIARPRRGHLDPAGRALASPRVLHPNRDRPAGALLQAGRRRRRDTASECRRARRTSSRGSARARRPSRRSARRASARCASSPCGRRSARQP